MATWTDGAAYAPIERPDGFATPVTESLPVAPPYAANTPGAVPRPTGFTPMPPGPPLQALGAAPPPTRNPAAPFEVRSALLTPTAPGFGRRNPVEPFAVASVAMTGPGGPMGAPRPEARLDSFAAPYPVPQPAPATQLSSAQRTFFAIAGVGFLMGSIVPAAAPWLFVIGGGLLLRTNATGRQLGYAGIGVGILAVLPLLYGEIPLLVSLFVWAGVVLSVASFALGANRPKSPGPY
ncbi:MAG: hypothetical protein Q4D79_01325 [Propionibacteriaceae bacterium]|nr:hypothetical protein [Propionibacteriaceae bacterium]